MLHTCDLYGVIFERIFFLWGSETKTSLHHEAERLNIFLKQAGLREEKMFTYATWAFLWFRYFCFCPQLAPKCKCSILCWDCYETTTTSRCYFKRSIVCVNICFSVSFDTVFPPVKLKVLPHNYQLS